MSQQQELIVLTTAALAAIETLNQPGILRGNADKAIEVLRQNLPKEDPRLLNRCAECERSLFPTLCPTAYRLCPLE